MQVTPHQRAGNALPILLLAAITVLGLVLRLPSFGNSLFGDEVGTYYIVTDHSLGGLLHLQYGHSVDLTPPLYFVLAWLAEQFGNSPQMLRLVPLLAGVATIVGTYFVGIRTVGRRAALVGAALLAFSPFLIFYSTEARAYAPVMALTLGSTLALLAALERRRTVSWVAYGALSCAAVYTHYTAVFVLGTQLIWALFTFTHSRRPLLLANACAALAFVPWIPALLSNTRSFGTRIFGIVEPLTPHAVAHDLAHSAVGHPYLALGELPGAAALALIGAGLLIGVGGIVPRPRERAGRPLLAALLALATPVGLGLYSVFGNSVWDMRNLIVSWPGLALVAAWVLTGGNLLLRTVATTLALGGFALAAVALQSPVDQRPDYTAAARFVLRSGGRGDPVAVVPAPTPGPLSAMDAAFAYAGDARRSLIRIGAPPLQAVLHAPPYAVLPASNPLTLARQAEQTSGGRLYVVAPGTAPLAAVIQGTVNVRTSLGPVFGTGRTGQLLGTVFIPLSAFLKAALKSFRPAQTRTFTGFLPLSVYVLARR